MQNLNTAQVGPAYDSKQTYIFYPHIRHGVDHIEKNSQLYGPIFFRFIAVETKVKMYHHVDTSQKENYCSNMFPFRMLWFADSFCKCSKKYYCWKRNPRNYNFSLKSKNHSNLLRFFICGRRLIHNIFSKYDKLNNVYSN